MGTMTTNIKADNYVLFLYGLVFNASLHICCFCYFAFPLYHVGQLSSHVLLSFSPWLKMNFSTNAHCGSHTSKENIPLSSKVDASQVQRAKQRTVLGVLSENEQRGRSFSQVGERGTVEHIEVE